MEAFEAHAGLEAATNVEKIDMSLLCAAFFSIHTAIDFASTRSRNRPDLHVRGGWQMIRVLIIP